MNGSAILRNASWTKSDTLRHAQRSVRISMPLAVALVAGMSLTTFAQNFFQNLDFELASGMPAPTNYPQSIAFSQALPGWTGYCGTNQQTTVLYDLEWLDTAGISILDFDSSFEPAALQVTHGHYSVCL